MVQDFDCLNTENIGDLTRVYKLQEGGLITIMNNSQNIVGKGLLLKNISKDQIISYGVVSQPIGYIPPLDADEKDIVAVCHD